MYDTEKEWLDNELKRTDPVLAKKARQMVELLYPNIQTYDDPVEVSRNGVTITLSRQAGENVSLYLFWIEGEVVGSWKVPNYGTGIMETCLNQITDKLLSRI